MRRAVLIVVSLLLLSKGAIAERPEAVILKTEGNVWGKKKGTEEWKKATPQMELSAGDVIKNRKEFPLGGRRLLSVYEEASLRGYELGEFWGNYIILGNAELRIPLIDELRFAFPISIRNIRSVIFVDVGSAWSKGERLTIRHNSKDEKKDTDLKACFGIGFRILVGFLPLRLDYTWNTDFVDTSDKPQTNFSIGYDF